MQHPATTAEIYDISRRAVAIFARSGLTCCLTGGTACALYGTTRRPNDVDLIVLTHQHQQERLKQLLVCADSDFYTVAAKDPLATYRVLWCRLPGSSVHWRRCKVDILVPGVMNIPDIPRADALTISGLPVMPLVLLLCLKLQSWADHRAAVRYYLVQKQHDDVRDIGELLVIMESRGTRFNGAALRRLPPTLADATIQRLREFVSMYPSSRAKWQAVGALRARQSKCALLCVLAASRR